MYLGNGMVDNKLPTDQKSSYRRGTVMGLTAAEAFMLISFILLLLLGLWRIDANERLSKAEEFSEGLTPAQRDIALENKHALEELHEKNKKLEKFSDELKRVTNPEELSTALDYYDGSRSVSLEDIKERIRLLEKDLVKRLAELAAEMPEDKLLTLMELAAIEELPNVQQIESAFSDLEKYEESGVTAKEAIELGKLREIAGNAGLDIAEEIRREAGDIIESLGGEILNNGNVIFPDSVLFDAGSAVIRPRFDTVLESFCRPWVEILYDVDKSLRSVQIEGHASSDWGDASPGLAFELNLDLSQERAGAVFKRCLNYAGSDEIAQWARSRMAAIGYSSSRPVLIDGQESRELSRRVVFAIDTRTDAELLAEAKNES